MAGADAFGVDFDRVQAAGDPAFTVDVDGFEGPLDLLLELARRQKVDLSRISVLALAEQYLAFVEAARKLRLELAADYLVMAAWLAYLKSRLLLPAPRGRPSRTRPSSPRRSPIACAASRPSATPPNLLMRRPRGSDATCSRRGAPEVDRRRRRAAYEASLYDLLSAYARQAQKHAPRARALENARASGRSPRRARRLAACSVGVDRDWTAFDEWLIEACVDPKMRRSARASSFSASLELVRGGQDRAPTGEGLRADLDSRGRSQATVDRGPRRRARLPAQAADEVDRRS